MIWVYRNRLFFLWLYFFYDFTYKFCCCCFLYLLQGFLQYSQDKRLFVCVCLTVKCALAEIKYNLKQAYNIKTEEKNTFFPFFVCFEVHDHLSFACIIEILLTNELYPYAESVLWSSLNDCKNLNTQLYSNVILCNFKVNLISVFEIKSAERQTCG